MQTICYMYSTKTRINWNTSCKNLFEFEKLLVISVFIFYSLFSFFISDFWFVQSYHIVVTWIHIWISDFFIITHLGNNYCGLYQKTFDHSDSWSWVRYCPWYSFRENTQKNFPRIQYQSNKCFSGKSHLIWFRNQFFFTWFISN